MDEILNMLADASIELTGTPLSGGKAADVMNAWEQVSQTPLFRQVIERIQNGLKDALSAVPEQYPALREEYRQYTILNSLFEIAYPCKKNNKVWGEI